MSRQLLTVSPDQPGDFRTIEEALTVVQCDPKDDHVWSFS